jgi:hypothetical protein
LFQINKDLEGVCTLFPKLHLELRNKIWDFAFDKPTTVFLIIYREILRFKQPSKPQLHNVHNSIPHGLQFEYRVYARSEGYAALRVNRESNSVFKSVKPKFLQFGPKGIKIPYNKTTDTIKISPKSIFYLDQQQQRLHRPSGYFRGLEEIEKISLPSGSSVYFEQLKQALWADFLDEVQRSGFVEQEKDSNSVDVVNAEGD